MMINILIIAAWTLMFVIVLYIWADVRETKNMVSVLRRESLRDSVSVRSNESFPNLRESDSDSVNNKESGVSDSENRDNDENSPVRVSETSDGEKESDLKPLELEEEKILSEVLTKFLG